LVVTPLNSFFFDDVGQRKSWQKESPSLKWLKDPGGLVCRVSNLEFGKVTYIETSPEITHLLETVKSI